MSISRWRSLAGLVAACLSVAVGCRPHVPPKAEVPRAAYLEPAGSRAFSTVFDDGDQVSLVQALDHSISYYRRRDPAEIIEMGGLGFSASAMLRSLERLRYVVAYSSSAHGLRDALAEAFSAYRVTVSEGVLFTGYYHPLIAGSLRPDELYKYPIWGRPVDLVSFSLRDFCAECPPLLAAGRVDGARLLPYFSRAEIEEGALARRARPIAWARDPLDVLFLQIQGSGSLVLPDGRRVGLAFAGSNGFPYRSIGRRLVEIGKLSLADSSAQAVRRYLAEHPEEAKDLINYNPRYVFFSFSPAPVTGSLGVPLTPGRSIAADPAYYAPGVLAFVRTRRYEPSSRRYAPLGRLVLHQDSGAAIRGPARVDIYWGEGEEAETIAGRQRSRGEMLVFAPREQSD